MVKTAKEQLREDLNRTIERLSAEQLREVADFASFLAERQTKTDATAPPRQIRFEGWAGCLSHVDKSAVELQHEATREWAERTLKEADDVSGGQ